jgi:hypothetical protein
VAHRHSDVGDLLPVLRFLDIQRIRKHSMDTFRKLDAAFESIINERMTSRGRACHDENDLLDTMLGLLSVDRSPFKQVGFRKDIIKAVLWVRMYA